MTAQARDDRAEDLSHRHQSTSWLCFFMLSFKTKNIHKVQHALPNVGPKQPEVLAGHLQYQIKCCMKACRDSGLCGGKHSTSVHQGLHDLERKR
eukprot:5686331-Amphidinium_carterae.1